MVPIAHAVGTYAAFCVGKSSENKEITVLKLLGWNAKAPLDSGIQISTWGHCAGVTSDAYVTFSFILCLLRSSQWVF